jgi:hypothetical protein
MPSEMTRFSSVISRDVFKSGALSDSSKVDLEAYFVAVKIRYESGEEYPYDLEELVPTVFAQKVKAIEALERDFTQDIDYRLFSREGKNPLFTRSGENPIGGRPSVEYRLSPLAFEFMAARKSKAIFSLYHAVFHAKTTPSLPRSFADALRLAADQQERIEQQQRQIEAMRPAQAFHDQITGSDELWDQLFLFSVLKNKTGQEFTQRTWLDFLRRHGIAKRANPHAGIGPNRFQPRQAYIGSWFVGEPTGFGGMEWKIRPMAVAQIVRLIELDRNQPPMGNNGGSLQ